MTLNTKAIVATSVPNTHEGFVPSIHACEFSPEEGFRYYPSNCNRNDAAAGSQDS